jgi:rRNA maturation RNase YbeY
VRLALPRASGEVGVLLTRDAAMRRLNRRALRHDRVTDVLAFPYADGTGRPGEPFGDIAVCVPQAARQARALGHPLLTELVLLAAHGALHLAGHDDRAPAPRRRMFAAQDRIVRRLLRK